MKQSLSRARIPKLLLLFAIVGGALAITACARPSRAVSQTTKLAEPASAAVADRTSQRLNINTASAAQLETLPGLGKILAERIVAHREQYGPFRRVEHLLMVHGFSDHKFRTLRELITVE
jgi:competence protein ComEA